jgi:hypothetical protein
MKKRAGMKASATGAVEKVTALRMTGARYGADGEPDARINSMTSNPTPRGRVVSILTDMHFWVPAIVLLGGLLLLKFLH